VQSAAAAGLRTNAMSILLSVYFRTRRAANDADAKLHTWVRKKEVALDALAASREALVASHDAGKVRSASAYQLEVPSKTSLGELRKMPTTSVTVPYPSYTHIPVRDTH
jgi:hypothetical protein